MRKLDLEQRSQEWLKFRQSKIGSSDAPIIAGVSPYKTPYQLWEEKLLGKTTATTPAMQRGLDLEGKAREQYSLLRGYVVTPCVVLDSSTDWKIASLDGIDESEKNAVEIKCPGEEDHKTALAGKIPVKYMPQLQHQIHVCELDKIDYFSFNGTEGVVVVVPRDDSYIKKLNDLEEEFYDKILSFTQPEMTDRDFYPVEDTEFLSLIIKWQQLETQAKELEEVRKKIIAKAAGRNYIGAGTKILRYAGKGRIDYASVPELQHVDLEKYRRDPIECWRISRCKE